MLRARLLGTSDPNGYVHHLSIREENNEKRIKTNKEKNLTSIKENKIISVACGCFWKVSESLSGKKIGGIDFGCNTWMLSRVIEMWRLWRVRRPWRSQQVNLDTFSFSSNQRWHGNIHQPDRIKRSKTSRCIPSMGKELFDYKTTSSSLRIRNWW